MLCPIGRLLRSLLLSILAGAGAFLAAKYVSDRRKAMLDDAQVGEGGLSFHRTPIVDLTEAANTRRGVFDEAVELDDDEWDGDEDGYEDGYEDEDDEDSYESDYIEDHVSPAPVPTSEQFQELRRAVQDDELTVEDVLSSEPRSTPPPSNESIDEPVESTASTGTASENEEAEGPVESVSSTEDRNEQQESDEAEGAEKEGATSHARTEPSGEASTEPLWVKPVEGECPLTHPIKARYATGRYYERDAGSYDAVVPDCCYGSVEDAESDGFSPSRY